MPADSEDEQHWFNFMEFVKSKTYMGTPIEKPIQHNAPSKGELHENAHAGFMLVEGHGVVVISVSGMALVPQEELDCVEAGDCEPLRVLSARPSPVGKGKRIVD